MLAIAEFGSTTRHTQDCHSDHDLLIVCERNPGRKLSDKYQDQGYSVTLLTPRQLKFMQKRGSLFIQHLKYESRILCDTNSELRNYLESSPLISPSKGEIERCISTLEYIGSWPNDSRLTGWRADFLYCVSRDLLIKYLAKQRVLAFGLEDLESALIKEHRSKFNNLYQLRRLRESKAAYRGALALPTGTNNAIETWLEEISHTLGVSFSTKQTLKSEEVICNLKTRSFSSSYELLRSVEAAYCILRSHGHLHPEHEKLMKHIQRPNAYSSSQIRKHGVIKSYLEDIIQIMVNNRLHRDTKLPVKWQTELLIKNSPKENSSCG